MTHVDWSMRDSHLTGYLDGELELAQARAIEESLATDAAMAERLSALEEAKQPLIDTFDMSALQAPSMPSDLAKAINDFADPMNGAVGKGVADDSLRTMNVPSRSWFGVTGRRMRFASALAASFAAGFVVMGAHNSLPNAARSADWVDIVASYQALYVTQTLEGPTQLGEKTEAVLRHAEETFGVDLRAVTDLEGLTFKRAQILGLENELLLQVAYLDEAGVPFAFCVTRVNDGQDDGSSRMSHALASHSWVDNGIGYVLVGGHDLERVENLSASLIAGL
ncbi:MAG: hypothetical protein AAF590_08485 [Pseudomonadota bacterium]